SVKALAEAEGVDRNIITRCINTAGLPKDIIAIFNILVSYQRAGHDLFKIYQGNEKAMLDAAQQLLRMKKQGEK
ncbi:chromosome partitioning protein ParB, partial [Klebsiella pneumoniae]